MGPKESIVLTLKEFPKEPSPVLMLNLHKCSCFLLFPWQLEVALEFSSAETNNRQFYLDAHLLAYSPSTKYNQLYINAAPVVRRVVEDGDACKGKLKKHIMQVAALDQPVHARDSFDCKSKQKDGIKDSDRVSGMKSMNLSNRINISKNQHDVLKYLFSEHPKGKVIVQTPTATSNWPGRQGSFKPLSGHIKAPKERIAERGDKVDAKEVACDKVKKAQNLFGLICEELLRDKEAKRNITRRIDCKQRF